MSPRSVNTIARTLIQTVVRQKLNAIKSDPERSLRNLVDMGLSFAAGSEQKRFLQQAQRTLQDENSAYYRIIYDMALHVDTEHLMGFGMNLGYNSLTAGPAPSAGWKANAATISPGALPSPSTARATPPTNPTIPTLSSRASGWASIPI